MLYALSVPREARKGKRASRTDSFYLPASVICKADWQLLLVAVAIAAHELVDAAGGVHQFRLARVEGVRAAGDFDCEPNALPR